MKRYVYCMNIWPSRFIIFDRKYQQLLWCNIFYWCVWDSESIFEASEVEWISEAPIKDSELLIVDSYRELSWQMTPEQKMVDATTWVVDFWIDYKEWMTKDELSKKYKWAIEYDGLFDRFINLFLENQKLKDKIEKCHKALV